MNPDAVRNRAGTEGLWDWNLTSNRIHFSPKWIALLGCEDHEIDGTQEAWLQRVHPEERRQVRRTIAAHLSDGASEFDIRHRMLHKDGSYRWMSCRALVHRNAAGQAIRVMGSHTDLTADTVVDPLTGLPNRLLFVERLTRSIERADRHEGFHYAVLLIDLDRPADPEEPSRSTAADPLLNAVARRLETCLRVGDPPPSLRNNDLVARLEAGQFGILLDGLKEVGHATFAADRILAGLLAPFALGGREVLLSASIGIAVSATGYSRTDDVLRDAETALHRAKQLGGTRCEVFDTAALKSAQAELQLEADFKGAIERGEFQLFYQPIVSLASNRIVGFEALARWQHPVLGVILPAEFVPIAEKTGFIVPLGNWVVGEACLRLKAWQESLPLQNDLWVSVNLSSLQFRHPDLAEQIGGALRDSTLEARCLVLELTEGVAMENPTAARSLLMHLRVMGVRISIDDFGTGHSSLSSLRQFPVDALKVDRSLVRGIETNKEMRDIFGTITALARQLDLGVIAEGIENEDQLALVHSLRCEYGQGYLFARPLEHEKAAVLLETGLPTRRGIRDGETAPTARLESHAAEQPEANSRSRARSTLYAVTAALALLVVVGFPYRVTQESSIPVASSPQPPLQNAEEGPGPGPLAGSPIPPGTPAEAAAPAASSVPARVVPLAPRPLTSLRVVHRHRLGSCRGVLAVSRSGVAFVPEESDEGKDAFTFEHGQFIYDLDDDSLTIRSNDRTYRFTSAAAAGKGDNGDELRRLAASIARFR